MFLYKGNVEYDTHKFDKYQNIQDSLLRVNDSINNRNIRLEALFVTLSNQRANSDTKIVYIKQKQQKNEIIINGFDVDGLVEFFGQRTIAPSDSTVNR